MGGTLSCAGRGHKPEGEDNKPYGHPIGNGEIVKQTDIILVEKKTDVTTPLPLNNNNNDIKPNVNGNQHVRPAWKFWQRMSLRRSNRKHMGPGRMGRSLSSSDAEIPLPDIVDQKTNISEMKRSSSLNPPPKPPRLFLFRSNSTNTPRNSMIESNRNSILADIANGPGESARDTEKPSNVGSDKTSNAEKENISPVTNGEETVKHELTQKCNSLPARKFDISSKQEERKRESTKSTGKIKIVSPDLSRKSGPRPRKKSGEITAADRHMLIMQSVTELICQKLDPYIIVQDLAEADILNEREITNLKYHSDNRYMCEGIVQAVMERDYQAFLRFCDLLRSKTDLSTVASILDAMKDIYDVIYEVPIDENGDRSPIFDNEKSISFDVVYYSLETGKVRSVVELEKTRNTENKRHSRDLLMFKRNSRLSFHSLTSEASSVFSEDLINTGLPMVTVSISGHDLGTSRAKALATVLEDHSCILELHVGKTHLRGPDLEHIGNALVHNWSLGVLDLRLNNICNEGAAYLANVLLHNRTLRQLNLSSSGIDSEGCKLITEALRTNTSLLELDLSFLDIGDGGCLAISDMLRVNRTLHKLRLRSGNISWIGCGFLMEGLEQGKTVTELDLSRNFIGDKGTEMLFRHIKDESPLRELNLENCGITAAGCSILSDVILTNKNMRHLDISVNFIGDQGITKLSNALERNKQIKTLGLNMCGISNDGFSKLLDILESNTTLTLLKLCYNRLGREHNNPEATSDNLKYRIRIVTSSNPKLKLLLWGNTFDELPAVTHSRETNGIL